MKNAFICAASTLILSVSPLARGIEEMDAAYEETLDALDIEHRAVLERAQQAWVDYRDATCELIAERPGYPDIAASALESCLDFMARERAAELRLLQRAIP